MAVVNSNYLPGDPLLVDQIVYELKAQGIFDQFRKECIADVDTKPAYQNLRQRVEGSVTGFLRKQKWNPDMNKNQVREMLRKSIYESGFLETGVERIVNQVVNPKIEKVFQPKVAEVVYKYLGIEKPKKDGISETKELHVAAENLLPTDLEAVSPESVTVEKKQDKSFESQNLEDSKNDEDESPPFEPLEEKASYLVPEENSIDSHLSGFSGLASHDSNSNENSKPMDIDIYNQDSQVSKHSSEEQTTMSILEENDTKMEGGDDSRASKSSKSRDSPIKNFDFSPDIVDKGSNSSKSSKKEKIKSDDKTTSDKKSDSYKHRSRHDSKSDNKNDKKVDKKDSKDRSRESRDSSKDSKDRRDSKSSSRNNKDRERRSSSSKHSNSRDHSSTKKESSSKNEKSNSSHKDYKRDSKSNNKIDKHRKEDKSHRSHSSSNKSEKDKGESKKESKKESKDDHFSSKGKKSDRRSTDRDSNDGHSGTGHSTSSIFDNNNIPQSNKVQETTSNSGTGSNDSGASDNTENINVDVPTQETCSVIKLIKPKFASNIHEARKLMKIRRQLHKLEKKIFVNNVIATTPTNETAIDTVQTRNLENFETVAPPLQNSVSAASWDAIEAKLNSQIDYNSYGDYPDTPDKNVTSDLDDDCLYLPNEIPPETLRYKIFIENLIDSYYDHIGKFSGNVKLNRISLLLPSDHKGIKRKLYNHDNDNDLQNNNKKNNNNLIESHDQSFPLPLSPAESDKSFDKKLYSTDLIDKQRKNNNINKAKATQRYSSDDLYKPRLFNGSRRRTGRSNIIE